MNRNVRRGVMLIASLAFGLSSHPTRDLRAAAHAHGPSGSTRQAGLRPAWSMPVPASPPMQEPDPGAALLKRYCQGCHNGRVKAGGLALDALDLAEVGGDAATWEKVVRKLRAGVMPPAGMPRPDEPTTDRFVSWLQTELDRFAAAHPNPGRTEPLHRLNRTEYHNAVRDLLALDIDVADYLPADDSSYGFDNIASALNISQSLLERYMTAARTISRAAVGRPLAAVETVTYRVSPSLQQHDRAEDLPFGTRGGALVRHLFPVDAEYDVRIEIAGAGRMLQTHQLEITLDGRPVKLFTLSPQSARQGGEDQSKLDVRVPVSAGPRDVGVTFYKKPAVLVEGLREPLPNPRFDGGPGGSQPTVASVTVAGPLRIVPARATRRAAAASSCAAPPAFRTKRRAPERSSPRWSGARIARPNLTAWWRSCWNSTGTAGATAAASTRASRRRCGACS